MSPSERRAHPRIPVTASYAATILSPTGALLGIAVPIDVSRKGFRADASRQYPQGGELRLEVSGERSLAGRIPFVVAWSQRVAGGWQIGGSFTQELTDVETTRLAEGSEGQGHRG